MDEPKSLRFPEARTRRLAAIDACHVAPLTDFVRTLRTQMGAEYGIPYFDPLDGGTRADCLFLLEAPGAKAVASQFISRDNPDETAKDVFLLSREAGIDRRSMAEGAGHRGSGFGGILSAPATSKIMTRREDRGMKKAIFLSVLALSAICAEAQPGKATKAAFDSKAFDASLDTLPVGYRGHDCTAIAAVLKKQKTVKDEMETTDEYKARMESMSSIKIGPSLTLGDTVALRVEIHPDIGVKYMADARMLYIMSQPQLSLMHVTRARV